MTREEGSIGDLLAAGLCMLAMTVLLLSYMGNVQMIYQKTAISQIARKYILRMETIGSLTEADRVLLMQELETVGVTEPKLDGSSLESVGYGNPVILLIRGKLEGEYDFEEKRVSTAKY